MSPCRGNREMSLKYSEIHLLSDMFLGMYSQLLFCLHIFLTSSAHFLLLFPLQINLGIRCRFVPLASATVASMTCSKHLPFPSSWCHHTSCLYSKETPGPGALVRPSLSLSSETLPGTCGSCSQERALSFHTSHLQTPQEPPCSLGRCNLL